MFRRWRREKYCFLQRAFRILQLADVKTVVRLITYLPSRSRKASALSDTERGSTLADEFEIGVVELPFDLEAWERLFELFPARGRDDVEKSQFADDFVRSSQHDSSVSLIRTKAPSSFTECSRRRIVVKVSISQHSSVPNALPGRAAQSPEQEHEGDDDIEKLRYAGYDDGGRLKALRWDSAERLAAGFFSLRMSPAARDSVHGRLRNLPLRVRHRQ